MILAYRIFLVLAVVMGGGACQGEQLSYSGSGVDAAPAAPVAPEKEFIQTPQFAEIIDDFEPTDDIQQMPIEEEDLPKAFVRMPEVPANWAKCWVSARVASAFAFAVKQNDVTGGIGGLLSAVTKGVDEKDIQFSILNPNITATCRLDWLSSHGLPSEYPSSLTSAVSSMWSNLEASVSCIAPVDPLCRCFGLTQHDRAPQPDFIIARLCQQQVCNGDDCFWGQLHMTDVPQKDLDMTEFSGCKATFRNAFEMSKDLSQSSTPIVEKTFSNGCRVDTIPFAPLPEEQDWYGDEIRDEAVITCENKLPSSSTYDACKCYALAYKSTKPVPPEARYFSWTCTKCTASGTCAYTAIPQNLYY